MNTMNTMNTLNTKHMPYGSHYSEELNSTILRLIPKYENKAEMALQALKDLGPSAFFQTTENEEQAKGAIRLLEWIETYLDHEPKAA